MYRTRRIIGVLKRHLVGFSGTPQRGIRICWLLLSGHWSWSFYEFWLLSHLDHAKNSKVRLLRPNNQDNVIEQMLPSLVDYIQPNKTCEIDFQSRRSILWGHGYGAPKKNVMAQNFKSTNLVCLYWFICVFSLQHFNGFIGVYNSITLPKSFWLFLQNPSHLTPRLAPQYFSNYFGFFFAKIKLFWICDLIS